MPNIKSAKKRVLLSREANVKNKMAKSALKTTLKKFDSAVVAGNREEATAAYKAAVVAVDKAAVKGILPEIATGASALRNDKSGVTCIPREKAKA